MHKNTSESVPEYPVAFQEYTALRVLQESILEREVKGRKNILFIADRPLYRIRNFVSAITMDYTQPPVIPFTF